MDHPNPFNLKVIRRPEGKDEEKANEEEGPGRVVLFFVSHWFVGWRGGGPDVDVCRGELRSVHSSGASSVAVSVGRLREASMTGRRKEADRVSACNSPSPSKHSRQPQQRESDSGSDVFHPQCQRIPTP